MSLKNRLLQSTLLVISLTVGMQAQENRHCSNATLHGSYGFHATGTGFVAIGRSFLMEMVALPGNSS